MNRAGFAGGNPGAMKASWQANEQIFPRVRHERSHCFGDLGTCRAVVGPLISAKLGGPQMLNKWVRRSNVDRGKLRGVTTEMAGKMKALERENRQLKQAKRSWAKRPHGSGRARPPVKKGSSS